MSLIKARPPRWYKDSNGIVEACYQLPKKNGNGVKEPTLREARELGLLPSVTTILNVMAKPGLERWKIEQAIHSALTLPRVDGEGEDTFAARIAQDMEAQANKAAEFGSRIHDAIADILIAGPDFIDGDERNTLEPFLGSFRKWANQNIEEVHAVEKVVGGKQFGYAGRMDLDCTLKGVGRCVVDFKTQNIKEGKEPVYYEIFPMQLAAYEQGFRDGLSRDAVSIIIPSADPGPMHVKVWDDLWRYKELFHCAFELWKFQNDYDPKATT